MPLTEEIQEILPGCHTWQAFSSVAQVDLTSHALRDGGQLYLVDPIRLSRAGLQQLEEIAGRPTAIFLTNGNHERDALFYRDRYHIPIHAAPSAMGELGCTATAFSTQTGNLQILPLPGAGAGETGIYDPARKLLCLGDILINLDAFAFAPLPVKYATDPAQMQQSIRSLQTLDVSTICFAHGLPITHRARERLAELHI